MKARVENLRELEKDEYSRAAKIMDIYAVDPVRFIEDFCFIKADKLDGSPKPFFLFDYQKELIHRVQEAENADSEQEFLTDKPREMGVTWLMCCYFLWRFLFTPNYSAFILSRTESEVDDGTRNPQGSIFSKVRWQIDKMPSYLLPASYRKKVSRGTTTDMNLKILNPDMGSSLTGSSTNSSAGRSRRYTATFVDEIFFIDRFQDVYRSLQSVSRAKIFTSTVVYGRNYEGFKNKLEADGNYMSLKWSDHPFKDKEWYEEMGRKAEELGDPDIMREVEPSYALSSKVQYYPHISQAMVRPVQYSYRNPLATSLDLGGKQDLTVIIYWQFDGTYFYCLDAFWNRNKAVEWYVPFLNRDAIRNPEHYNDYHEKFIEKIQKWNKPLYNFGEADHFAARHPTNTSSAYVLAKQGVRLTYNRYAIQHPQRHHATSQLLPKTVFNSDSDGAMRVYDAIANSRYASSVRTTTENLKPVHDDEIADFRAAAENFYVNVPRIFRSQREDVKSGGMEKDFVRGIMQKLRI